MRRFACPSSADPSPARPRASLRALTSTLLGFGLAGTLASVLAATPSAAGSLARLDVVARGDAATLPVLAHQGRHWVVGTPGQEYAIRVCNSTGGRLLAVTSVDGINVITGETAAPHQPGYVVDAFACADIGGWRKSMARTAAFYFTELADAYAARTGRPDNLGVIGVALFREKPPPVAWRDPAKISADAEGAAAAGASLERGAAGEAKRSRDEAVPAAATAPPPQTMLGTGHGRSERSHALRVAFARDSADPAETLAIHYDRRENLAAMGILPPPTIARSRPANPFPGWPGFAPDPPRR